MFKGGGMKVLILKEETKEPERGREREKDVSFVMCPETSRARVRSHAGGSSLQAVCHVPGCRSHERSGF